MSGWDELVAAALIGTDRRPVEPAVPDGSPAGLEAALRARGAEDRLLGAAAAWTVARRAGAMAGALVGITATGAGPDGGGAPSDVTATAADLPSDAAAIEADRKAGAPSDVAATDVGPPARRAPSVVAAADPRPAAPGTALRDRLGGVFGTLLGEWLALAAERGLRPPPELVPALLDRAASDPGLHTAAAEAAGPLGAWLAERNPRWAFVRGAVHDAAAVWAEGASEERRALLDRLRRADPAAGRALLAGTFADDAWEDRAVFLSTLAHGLSDGDEPLLETALNDRRKPVRDAAAHLLAALPRSRFAARMAARTAPLLRVEDGRLVVELPREPDAAARRDGVPASGRRSDRLRALLAATPLATWTGGARPAPPVAAAPAPAAAAGTPPAPAPTYAATAPTDARELSALPVADDLAAVVHSGWVDAAVTQRDAGWARALWAVHPDPAVLVALPAQEAQRLAAQAAEPDVAASALAAPWGHALSKAVIDAIHRRRAAGERGPDVEFAGYRLDPALAHEAEERLRELGGRDLRRLCDLLTARAAMLRELS